MALFVHVAVFRSSSFDRLHGLHFGAVLGKGQEPGSQTYRLPFHSGQADRCASSLFGLVLLSTRLRECSLHTS